MDSEISTNIPSFYEDLVKQSQGIDTTKLDENVSTTPDTKIVETTKIFFWIRLYLKEELSDLVLGDDIQISYLPENENLVTKFICFGKTNLNKDYNSDSVSQYDPDDDKKILCLMIDEETIKTRQDIPFIRTMFKTSIYYKYQLMRRTDLVFTNMRTNQSIEYIDCSF